MSALDRALGRAAAVAEEAAAATRAAPVDPAVRAALVRAGAGDGGAADDLWRRAGGHSADEVAVVRRAIVALARDMRSGSA